MKEAPHSLEAERCVLGGILLDNDAMLAVADKLTDEDFYVPAHRLVFASYLKLYDAKKPIDEITLLDALRGSGELDKVGGALAIASLVEQVPSAANIEYYAGIVRDKSLTRRMANLAAEIAKEGYAGVENVPEYIASAEQRVMEIDAAMHTQSLSSMRDLVRDTFKYIEKLYENKSDVTGAPTGFFKLDHMTSGLQKEDLIILAGRPSMGKTAFALNIAANTALKHNNVTAVFSLEMSKSQLVMRMLCSEARIDASRLRGGRLEQRDWPKLAQAAGKLAEAPMYIDDTGAISLMEMAGKCRRLKRECDGRLDLIVIDYLQLMSSRAPHGGKGRNTSRELEISEISRGLKGLAKELKVPVVALSQLNRSLESRDDKRPRLSDLRESGAIEQDADVIMFVYRDEVYNKDTPAKGVAEIIIGKQRNGPIGTVETRFFHEFTRFENLADEEVAA